MVENKTQVEKFSNIANAIREVRQLSPNYKIIANNFDSEIKKANRFTNNHPEIFDNGYYGVRAAQCAASYRVAKITGQDEFVYTADESVFSTKQDETSKTRYVRDARGQAKIDCSTFVGLCLRNIPYDKSPYARHRGALAEWNPSEELQDMYGNDGWEFKELDTQPSKSFNNIGIDGCSTVRFAADFGEYFSRYGFIIYDKDKDGELNNTANPLSDYNLKPGDLVFWSKKVNDRFKSITHIGIVAENTSRYFHVTGGEGKGTLDGKIVVFYPEFDDGVINDSDLESSSDDDNHPLNTLVLICRPDYRPRTKKEETPVGINLLGYPWSNGIGANFTGAGLSFSVEDIHTLGVSGTGNGDAFRLKGTTDTGKGDHIKLSPGIYELSGIDSKWNDSGTIFTLQVRNKDGSDLPEKVRYPYGSDSTNVFTIIEEKEVIVRLYCSSSVTILEEDNEKIIPTLIRLE